MAEPSSGASTRPAPTAAVAPRHPAIFGLLYFPFGLMIGYPAVALGYLGNRAGLPVSASAAIVGMAFLPHAWKFLWAPVADVTLTRKRWYIIACLGCAVAILGLSVAPIRTDTVGALSAIVLFANLCATFVAFSVEGLLAYNTPAGTRGRAAGWFQSGNQLGQTLGGGIGLWLAAHAPAPWMGGAALAAAVLACPLVLLLVEEPPVAAGRHLSERLRQVGRELLQVIRARSGWIGALLALLPIGSGAALYLFGALAPEWHASADRVAVVLGAAGGVVITLGCLGGGWVADRVSRPVAYAGATLTMVLAAAAMAVSPRTSIAYTVMVLGYTFTQGLCVATLTGMVFGLAGHGATAAKVNLFIALNTLSGLAMVRVDGAIHDRWNARVMLVSEAAIGAAALAIFFVVRQVTSRGEPAARVDHANVPTAA